jgi:hypothetical protein
MWAAICIAITTHWGWELIDDTAEQTMNAGDLLLPFETYVGFND